jgi:hypothetical protein
MSLSASNDYCKSHFHDINLPRHWASSALILLNFHYFIANDMHLIAITDKNSKEK